MQFVVLTMEDGDEVSVRTLTKIYIHFTKVYHFQRPWVTLIFFVPYGWVKAGVSEQQQRQPI